MRNKLFFSMVAVFLALAGTMAQDTTDTFRIYRFEIREQIAPPVWRTTQMAFTEAERLGVDLVLINMNTYGGMLESADSIRTRILQASMPVYVFIDHNAASAGALISIACDSIYMVPGATIGAATVVDQQGEVVPDKYQSYMRAMMRSTAEATGRDPDIAQAMVDPRIRIEGIIDSGSVLTFTATEAYKNGFCEGVVNRMEEVLTQAGIDDYVIIDHQASTMDKLIGFLINPVVSGILIMIIIGGLYFELQSPGVGFPLVASIIGALMYFAPLYLEGLAENWEIVIFVVGVVLVAVEIFALPGFGVAGISGVTLILAGLILSLVMNVGLDFVYVDMTSLVSAFFTVTIAIFLSLLLSYMMTRTMFTGNRLFRSLALDTSLGTSEGYTSSVQIYKEQLGKRGIAYSVLRPSGRVRIDNEIYDATAISGYIDKGEEVEVIRYSTAQLFVRKVDKP